MQQPPPQTQPSQPYQPYPGSQSAYAGSPGYEPYQSSYANQLPMQQGKASGRAIASLIMSIASAFTCGFLLSIPGMILGKMEMNAIRDGKAPREGETLAKIGFYTGLVVTILSCLGGLGLFGIFFLNALSGFSPQ
ncbi:MAG TPA: DUF4190 domain-containing protein [Blastocatellia bacterium]|nr:DUF4190 domain-containing protein [Blastocatellia bacterium]